MQMRDELGPEDRAPKNVHPWEVLRLICSREETCGIEDSVAVGCALVVGKTPCEYGGREAPGVVSSARMVILVMESVNVL
jgi:hypothetical protein